MHWYTLANVYLGRAVEQLGGCLAKERVEVEVQQSCNAELSLMNIYEI